MIATLDAPTISPVRVRRRPDPVFWSHRLRVLIRPFDTAHQLLPCLYVAGDLDHFEMPAISAMVVNLDYITAGFDGRLRAFRQLDARWMSYLSRRLAVAAARAPLHPDLSTRWSQVLTWAENRWTAPLVRRAIAQLPDSRYRAPALPAAA